MADKLSSVKAGIPLEKISSVGQVSWQSLLATNWTEYMDEAAPFGGHIVADGFAQFEPVHTIAGLADCGVLLICDHASNALPPEYGSLGVAQDDLERHIGYDIGAGALTHRLAEELGAPAVLSTFSRLLIDPNRGEDDPTLIMRISDGSIVPGNVHNDDVERERRLDRYYRPYNTAIADHIGRAIDAGRPPVLLSVHSYTRNWRGTERPWHGGILWDKDPRFAVPLLEELRAEDGLIIGDNEPYTGSLKNDTMYRHGTQGGLSHALLEVRNDLIAHDRGVEEWTDRIAVIIGDLLSKRGDALHRIERYGSHSDD